MSEQLITPIRRQHVVSRVVLKQFAVESNISVYDREADLIHSKGTGGVFQQPFDQFDSARSEGLWGQVETKMDRVFKLLSQRTALQDADAVDTLRDLIALHWIRSAATRETHERIAREAVAQNVQARAHQTGFLTVAFAQETGGLVPAGQGDLEWANWHVHQRIMDEHGERMWSQELPRRFNQVRQMISKYSVQIAYAEGDVDLAIGDAPVIAQKEGHEGVGPHQGVALGDASRVFMPVSPEILIALGPTPATVSLSRDDVLFYNKLQIRGFVRWLGCRPGGAFDTAMREYAPVKYVRP